MQQNKKNCLLNSQIWMLVLHRLEQEQSSSWVIFIFNNDVDGRGWIAYAFIFYSISVITWVTWHCTCLYLFFMGCSRPAGSMLPWILEWKDCVYIHDTDASYWQLTFDCIFWKELKVSLISPLKKAWLLVPLVLSFSKYKDIEAWTGMKVWKYKKTGALIWWFPCNLV